jgi:predicted lipoprotein
MTRLPPRPTPSRTHAAAALLAIAAGAAACERVTFWSSAGETDLQDGDGSAGVGPTGSGAGAGSATSVTVSVGTGTPVVPVDKQAVLEAVATCAVELYDEVAARTAALAEATDAAAASGTADDRDAARDAWRAAIDAWQQAELVRVGPAGPATLPEGRNLRDEIYSWPHVSRCLVEQTIVSRAYADEGFGASSLVNVRGLAAAEYLLFYDGTDNGCSASSGINSTGSWAALGAAELAARKADYAAVVATAADAEVRALVSAWSPGGGDFGRDLARAGASGSPFASDQSAIEAVSLGLFYLETEVKDQKVGKPLGVFECDESECLDAVESPFARRSTRHVENNLIGFQRVFDGCEAAGYVGFDDLLAAAGAADLGARMQEDVRVAIATAQAIEEDDLAVAILQNRPAVEALHAAIKRVTDELKTEVVTVLDIEPPATVEGDND